MRKLLGVLAMVCALSPVAVLAQDETGSAPASPPGPPTKTTFVRLTNGANAIIVEPVTPDPVRSRIAFVVAHPEHSNAFNYFFGRELPKRGYRVLMLNTYGPETSYDEFVGPIASAIKTLKAIPGVQKVVLAGHSTGGPELTSYQDIAENGAKACQGPERIYKCRLKSFDGLPKADGVMLIDSHQGSSERTIALNPAVGAHDPHVIHPALDMFSAKNGYDPKTKAGTYSSAFEKRYFAAQRARADGLIDEALARLDKIEKGKGVYKDDEPFVVTGSDLHINGARLDFADQKLMSRTHAPHVLLKADGTRPVQILERVTAPLSQPDEQDKLDRTVQNITVRAYLSFQALRLEPNFAVKEDTVIGVDWRSTPNSVPGNLEGIHVPTLVVVSTCAPHLVIAEIGYDLSAAADKEMVGLEGANHGLQACRPQYGDTTARVFNFIDEWLQKPGRF
jgi:hypothetical protein